MEAIILCGGLGTRLRPLTNNKPKALIEVGGKPIIDWQMQWLKKYKISSKDVVLACGYSYEKLQEHFGNSVKYSIEHVPLGTAGALKQALEHMKGENFLVFNVDDLNNVNLDKLKELGSHAICTSKLKSPFAVLQIENQYVVNYVEKPILDNWVSMGIYLLNKNLKEFLPDKGSLERDVFPKIKLKAFHHDGVWHTINTVREVETFNPEEFERYLR